MMIESIKTNSPFCFFWLESSLISFVLIRVRSHILKNYLFRSSLDLRSHGFVLKVGQVKISETTNRVVHFLIDFNAFFKKVRVLGPYEVLRLSLLSRSVSVMRLLNRFSQRNYQLVCYSTYIPHPFLILNRHITQHKVSYFIFEYFTVLIWVKIAIVAILLSLSAQNMEFRLINFDDSLIILH